MNSIWMSVMPQPTPRGRGTACNPHNRFAPTRSEAYDDGWEQEVPPTRATEVRSETAKTVITRNQSPDVGFDRSVNPYRGCEHGCIYCFARPSHAYWDLSPGIDFETRLIAKTNLAERLEQELSKPGYVPQPIALGVNTDAYQPLEREQPARLWKSCCATGTPCTSSPRVRWCCVIWTCWCPWPNSGWSASRSA